MPAGSRVRANNVYGTVSDNPLLIGAISYTSLGLSLLPAIASPTQHAVVVLDPKRVNGEPEIVVVTSHTALGTTATITRAAYGTTARAHPQGTAWAHVPVGPDDYMAVVTSGTRPSDPYQGQMIYETDTDTYTGRGAGPVWQTVVPLGAWTSYTPSNLNVTLGNGSQVAVWARVGRTIFVRYNIVFGTTTSFGGTVDLGLPVAAAATGRHILSGTSLQSGVRIWILQGLIGETDFTHARLVHTESGNNGSVNATNPFTYTTSSTVNICGCYEAAS